MKLILLVIGFVFSGTMLKAQDTNIMGTSIVIKDNRIDLLGKKMAEYNEGLATKPRNGKGYRLMVISTSNREQAMQLRSQLYRIFPDEKQYMSYQMPNIKIKLGNFTDRDDAERVRKLIIAQKLVTNNIYLVPETVELKPEKPDPADKN